MTSWTGTSVWILRIYLNGCVLNDIHCLYAHRVEAEQPLE
jgi:hypothetical protein